MSIRRRFTAMLAVMLALMCMTTAVAATPSDYNKNMPQVLDTGHLYAESAMIIDADTGEVLFTKNGRIRMYPASTTKIMTLLLAMESGIPMDTLIAIPRQASKIPGDSSLIPVQPGDEMTFRDLLYGVMINSGNDGANAVAVIVGGSLEGFVEKMNRRAEELGCEGTHFVNAHGYHDSDHYSTAQDLAIITSEALKYDEFKRIVSAKSYTMNITRNGKPVKIDLITRNSMLKEESSYFYADCIGVKSGYHSKGGYCFVGAAERDGVRLVSVVLKCAKDSQKYVDLTRLLNYGFTCYTDYTLEQMFGFAGDQIATVKISNASQDDPYGGILDMNIAQISDADYSRMVQTGNEAAMEEAVADFVSRSQLIITDNLVAPISEGEILGNFSYIAQSGEKITALLIASRSVAEQPDVFTLEDMFPFLVYLENPLVLALMIVLLLIVLLLILSSWIRKKRRERRRKEIYEARRRAYLRSQRMREEELARRRNAEARRRRQAAARKSKKRGKGKKSDRYDEYDEYDDYDDDLFGDY